MGKRTLTEEAQKNILITIIFLFVSFCSVADVVAFNIFYIYFYFLYIYYF